MKTKDTSKFPTYVILAVLFVWVAVSQLVFAFRHPWATETERLIYLPQALTFQTVDYRTARPRE